MTQDDLKALILLRIEMSRASAVYLEAQKNYEQYASQLWQDNAKKIEALAAQHKKKTKRIGWQVEGKIVICDLEPVGKYAPFHIIDALDEFDIPDPDVFDPEVF